MKEGPFEKIIILTRGDVLTAHNSVTYNSGDLLIAHFKSIGSTGASSLSVGNLNSGELGNWEQYIQVSFNKKTNYCGGNNSTSLRFTATSGER